MAQSTPDGTGRWVAAGAIAPNEAYIGQRLMYQRFADVERGLAGVVDDGTVRRILYRTILGGAWIGIFAFVLTALAAVTGSLVLSGLSLAVVLLTLCWIVVSLLLPVVDTLSQWHLLLDGKAWLAESAYAVLLRSLRNDHQLPIPVPDITVRRLRVGPPIPGVRNFLTVRLATYQIYVSVFAFGQDLFLGWTLRQRQASARVLLRWLVSQFRSDLRVADLIEVEPVHALRDAVHNALRQSIEAAALNQQTTITEMLGEDIPVVDHTGTRAAWAGTAGEGTDWRRDARPAGQTPPSTPAARWPNPAHAPDTPVAPAPPPAGGDRPD